MKISMLKLKNCLGIKELEFKPGQITLIQGEEGQGKTSILESIQRIFYNKSERPKFVRSDSDRAETYLMLDDGTDIKKYINSENKVTTVNVEKDGMQPKAAEAFLKGLVSERQLNPISLIEMPDKELTELILSLIPIKVTSQDLQDWVWEVPADIDLNKHGLQVCKEVEKYLYDKRTDLNRKVKDITAEVKTINERLPESYNADEWRNVSLSEKYEAISKANKVNTDRVKCQSLIDNVNVKISSIESERDLKVKQLEDEIRKVKEDARNRIDVENRNVAISKEYLENNPAIDIEPLEIEHRNAEEMKSYIRLADDLKDKEIDLQAKEKEVTTLTDKIEYMRTKPQMLLASAEMPISGLTVDSQGNVLINERPIINLSGGERIKFVMNIVRATAGALKIILIDGFEKLSPKSQKEFIEECTGDGFQYIITKVADGNLQIVSIDESGNAVDAETGELVEVA